MSLQTAVEEVNSAKMTYEGLRQMTEDFMVANGVEDKENGHYPLVFLKVCYYVSIPLTYDGFHVRSHSYC